MAESKLRVGVLIQGSVQLLDMAGVDLFFMLNKEYLKACQLPQPLVNQGLDSVDIEYIFAEDENGAASGQTANAAGERYAPLTSNVQLRTTATIASPQVAPGKLDVLLVPGPDPELVPSKEALDFIRGHVNATEKGTTLLCVCTGIFSVAASGVLDGRNASGPRGLLGRLKKQFKNVKWDDGTRRWVRDGSVWTSGGITNGLDMCAAFIKQKYPGPLSETVCALADVGDRGESYNTSNTTDTFGWLWRIIRAAIFGK